MSPYRARSIGHRLLGPSFDIILLMRPRQWPILSAQFALGALCAPAMHDALSLSTPIHGIVLLSSWFAWVVCLNGGTLAFNSAYDRDTESIAYLEDPPEPPPHSAMVATVLMLLSPLVGYKAGPVFVVVAALCVILSILYSHPKTRWKGIPGLDLLVNMVGFGAGTTLAGLAAGTMAAGGTDVLRSDGLWLSLGFALLFGSFYPMTQIYQLETDRRRGDRTLASALGLTSSLNLALVLGTAAAVCFMLASRHWQTGSRPMLIVLLVLGVWLTATAIWRRRRHDLDDADHARRMYVMLGFWALVDLGILAARYI